MISIKPEPNHALQSSLLPSQDPSFCCCKTRCLLIKIDPKGAQGFVNRFPRTAENPIGGQKAEIVAKRASNFLVARLKSPKSLLSQLRRSSDRAAKVIAVVLLFLCATRPFLVVLLCVMYDLRSITQMTTIFQPRRIQNLFMLTFTDNIRIKRVLENFSLCSLIPSSSFSYNFPV